MYISRTHTYKFLIRNMFHNYCHMSNVLPDCWYNLWQESWSIYYKILDRETSIKSWLCLFSHQTMERQILSSHHSNANFPSQMCGPLNSSHLYCSHFGFDLHLLSSSSSFIIICAVARGCVFLLKVIKWSWNYILCLSKTFENLKTYIIYKFCWHFV